MQLEQKPTATRTRRNQSVGHPQAHMLSPGDCGRSSVPGILWPLGIRNMVVTVFQTSLCPAPLHTHTHTHTRLWKHSRDFTWSPWDRQGASCPSHLARIRAGRTVASQGKKGSHRSLQGRNPGSMLTHSTGGSASAWWREQKEPAMDHEWLPTSWASSLLSKNELESDRSLLPPTLSDALLP